MNTANETVMPSNTFSLPVSKPRRWAGIVIAALVVIFLIFDAVMKVILAEPVIKASEQLGLPIDVTPAIGILLLACTLLYVIPRTSILGAILLTGYLGGAIAIHVRANNGWFPVVFALTFGVLIWMALVLREPGLMKLVFFRQWPAEGGR